MQVYYFSWVREKVGTGQEEIQTNSNTVRDLIDELSLKGENYTIAFSNLEHIKVAVDQVFVSDFNHPIKNAKEIAFFPPVTGG